MKKARAGRAFALRGAEERPGLVPVPAARALGLGGGVPAARALCLRDGMPAARALWLRDGVPAARALCLRDGMPAARALCLHDDVPAAPPEAWPPAARELVPVHPPPEAGPHRALPPELSRQAGGKGWAERRFR